MDDVEGTIPGLLHPKLVMKRNEPGRLDQLQAWPHTAKGALYPFPPGAAASALHSVLAGEEACAAGLALPNHIVNCFAAACES